LRRLGNRRSLTFATFVNFTIVPGDGPVHDLRHMSDHVYKKIELVGSSPSSIEEAVVNALTRAEKTIRNMRWFEVTETRGCIENGKLDHWQVTINVGFTLDT
jgi:flavin-binding protein dodecin